ncbi:TPA: hypothetical protein HA259_02670 [Thermoplasmata archaeon]|nr:hypothetical protein [Thermoplasmata archaeon]
MREVREVAAGGSTIHVLPVIRGLTSEIATVQSAFSKVKPDAVAVSLSEEDVAGLRNLPKDYEPELSRYDEIYVSGLARYGEVAAPPPCYVATVEIADSEGTPIIPIDIDESSYTELYCAAVSGTQLFRDSTRTWYLRKRAFSAETAEEYVMKVDRAFNNMRGFKYIEMQRADWMAKALLKVAPEHDHLLAIIEFERMEDVLRSINRESEGPEDVEKS